MDIKKQLQQLRKILPESSFKIQPQTAKLELERFEEKYGIPTKTFIENPDIVPYEEMENWMKQYETFVNFGGNIEVFETMDKENTVKPTRHFVNEMLQNHKEFPEQCEFIPKDFSLWENEESQLEMIKMLAFEGKQAHYKEGIVTLKNLSPQEFRSNFSLKQEAIRRFYAMKKSPIENQHINELLKKLPKMYYSEKWLPDFLIGENTFIYMFPKEKPIKSWNGLERFDVFIYDLNAETYSILRSPCSGFEQIMISNVKCRTGMADGGYFIQLYENAILYSVENEILYLVHENTPVKPWYTEEEMSEAIKLCCE